MTKKELEKRLPDYAEELKLDELKESTVKKYLTDARRFLSFMEDECQIDKESVIHFKEMPRSRYKPASVNSYLRGVNHFLRWSDRPELTVKTERMQKSFSLEMVLQLREYQQLLAYARREGKEKYYYMMRTLAGTGIRVGELKCITREALENRFVVIHHKGKIREICISNSLCDELLQYCQLQGIQTGPVFYGWKQGTAINETGVWKALKRLAGKAGVDPKKVYPHSFRHLFAKTYMQQIGNLTELSDILGHSSIETTRIYTMETMEEKRASLERLTL